MMLRSNVKDIFLKLKGKKILIIVAFLSGWGCSYDKGINPKDDTLCDVDSVTYSATIVPILEANCYTCHDASNAPDFAEGIVLEGYGNLMIQVNDKRLIGAIRHKPGFTAMPRELPQLPECTIREIETWVEAGAPDN